MNPLAAASAALLLALAPAALAQKDRIVWTDGTVSDDVRVQDFTWREIKFTEKGRAEQRPADSVASIEVNKFKEAYRRAYGATSAGDRYDQFLSIAESLASKEPFLAQWGYLEAARLQAKINQYGEAFAVLEKMVQDLPDTGFYPEVFRWKLDYYLAQGKDKAGSATAVAKKYNQTTLEKGFPDGFVYEASYYDLMARAVDGSLEGGALQGELDGLLDKTEGAYPAVADRVRVQLANAHRAANEFDEARSIYQKLADKAGIDETTRALALLGLGYTDMETADRTNVELYREALLSFLRVYLETPGVAGEIRAEALYNGALAAEKWRGPDSGGMARRLRGYLRRDFPDSPWASR